MKKGGKGIQEEHEQGKENRELGGNRQQVRIRVSHDTGGAVQDEAGELLRQERGGFSGMLKWWREVLLQQRRKDAEMCVLESAPRQPCGK